MHIQNTFCKKNWVKTAIPALSSGQSNLQTPIWGPSRQLDDQHRNPNINNRDHLVGQLTSSHCAITLLDFSQVHRKSAHCALAFLDGVRALSHSLNDSLKTYNLFCLLAWQPFHLIWDPIRDLIRHLIRHPISKSDVLLFFSSFLVHPDFQACFQTVNYSALYRYTGTPCRIENTHYDQFGMSTRARCN